MKRLLPILLLSLALIGCGKEPTSTAPEQTEPAVSNEKPVEVPTDTPVEPTSAEAVPIEKPEGIIGTWTQTDPDEEIVSLTFNEDTYTYQYDYSRAYEPGEEIDEDPVSGENGPFNYFLDSECIIELDDTVLTQINMSMDDELSSYGNCGIYDEKADCIYIGESFNNLLIQFIQQGHSTQKEWLEYIEDEYYLMFVR